MAAKDPSIYEYIIIESSDGKRKVNIEPAVVGFQYYEDIFSPTITAKMLIVNTGQSIKDPDGNKLQSLYNGLPIRGGERVVMKISGNTKDNPGLAFSKDDPNKHLYVSSVTSVSRTSTLESFVLNLVSREAITNETSRVGKKYKAGKISETVTSIVKEFLKTEKEMDVDETENKYVFIGNMRKPFTLLTWLASKSVPGGKETKEGSGGTAGYCFYETMSGFKYKSIDGLVTQEPFDKEYQYTEVVDSSAMEDDYKIIKYRTDENQDLLGKLKRGAYCSYRMYFDPLELNYRDKLFDQSDYSGKVKNTGEPIVLPPVAQDADKTLGEIPSRFITAIIDRGTFDPDPKTTAKELADKKDPNAYPMKVQAQSLMRYNTIMTQTISMTIPSNTNLEAGKLIKCSFPLLTVSKDKSDDPQQSGLYMIRGLCHYFDSDGSYTSLELIKDTFGEQEK
jgi:hypothetical protein